MRLKKKDSSYFFKNDQRIFKELEGIIEEKEDENNSFFLIYTELDLKVKIFSVSPKIEKTFTLAKILPNHNIRSLRNYISKNIFEDEEVSNLLEFSLDEKRLNDQKLLSKLANKLNEENFVLCELKISSEEENPPTSLPNDTSNQNNSELLKKRLIENDENLKKANESLKKEMDSPTFFDNFLKSNNLIFLSLFLLIISIFWKIFKFF